MLFRKRIYADAAAATPLSPRSRKELIRLLGAYGNAGALHHEALQAKGELDFARETIAEAIGAHADEIIFTASGTEANNQALQGIIRPLLLEHGEVHAITCAIEHQSVLVPLKALEREGLYVTEMSVDTEGFVSPKEIAEAITEQTVLISIQMVNSEVGTIEPLRDIAKEIRRIKKERGEGGLPLYFHTDASQAPLWVSVSVEKLGVDVLTLDGQKVLGPKGVGALYIKRGTHVEPILWGGSQEMSLRGGTPNVPLAGAFAVALKDAQEGVEVRATNIAAVRDFLWKEIQVRIPDAMLNGPNEHKEEGRAANNINVSVPGLDAEMAVLAFDAEGIAASTRSACNTEDEQPSHVIKALGTPKELAKSAIRLTLLPTATKGEAKRIAATLSSIEKRYRIVVK